MNPSVPNENPLAQDLDHILAHTGGLWEDLRGQKIFVTGGSGFFGRWLLESFWSANERLGLNARLVFLSRNPDVLRARAPHLFVGEAIQSVVGDVRTFSLKELHAQLPKIEPKFGFMVHAATAASAKLNHENPLLMFDTIVQGTRAALDLASAIGVRRFLLTSSGAVYGKQPSELTHIPEEYCGGPDCCDPASAYGEGKRAAEFLCASFGAQHGIDCLIARGFAFVGPFLPLDAHFAIGNFTRDALAGGPIRVGGDGTPHRSYLYAADLAIWLWTILFRGAPSRPYNVGSSIDLPIRGVAEAVRNAIDERITVTVATRPEPGAAPSRYVPATKRAETELGLAEHIALGEALRRTAAYARCAGKMQPAFDQEK